LLVYSLFRYNSQKYKPQANTKYPQLNGGF
jgi:hypothetical protein